MLNKKTMENWEKEYAFLEGYAERHELRNTLIALSVALNLHKGQKRDGGEPYIIHPLMVAKQLVLLNLEKELIKWRNPKNDKGNSVLPKIKYDCDIIYASALLHDVIEDCNLEGNGRELVEEYRLDEEVYSVVKVLTKPPKESGKYVPETYFKDISKDWRAILVKVADRANNCSTMEVFDADRMKRYIKETAERFYPLMKSAEDEFPQIRRPIKIMKNLIVSIVETLASLLNMKENIKENTYDYERMISFLEGASFLNMPETSKALHIALEKHKKQNRTSGDPFIIHPLRVCCYLFDLGIRKDEICAAALLHEIPHLNEKGWKEELAKYEISQMTIKIIEKVSDRSKGIDEYYKNIQDMQEAVLVKFANRSHTCTFLANANEEEIEKYRNENHFLKKTYEYGMLHYPNISNVISIMLMHINAITNIVRVVSEKNSENLEKKPT